MPGRQNGKAAKTVEGKARSLPRFRKVRKPPLLCVAAAVPPPLPIGTERVPFFSPDAVAPPPCRIRQCGRVARKSCACAPVARGCGFGANPSLPSSTMPGRGPTQESPPGNRAHVYNPSQAPMYRQEIKKGLLRLDFRGMGNWATEGIAQAFDVEQCGISREGNLLSIMLIKEGLGMPECKPFPVSLSMTAGGCIATKPPHRCPRGTDALLFHKGFLFAHQTAQKNTSVVRYPGFPRNFTWFRA